MSNMIKASACALGLLVTLPSMAYDRITGHHFASRSEAMAPEAESERLHGLNASGRSPMSLTAEYFAEQGLPPNTQGIAALQILNLLEQATWCR